MKQLRPALQLPTPTITPLTRSTATQLDNQHLASLTRRTTPGLRRSLATALSALRDSIS